MGKIKYTVYIRTSNEKKAGTNEDVWVQLIGTNGETRSTHFDNGGYNDFEQGDTDPYVIISDDIGELTHVVVALTAEGSYAGTIDMTAEAAAKGVAVGWQFADIVKWRSQHHSPSWHLDSISVVPTDLFMNVQLGQGANFTLRGWIPCGTIAKITRD